MVGGGVRGRAGVPVSSALDGDGSGMGSGQLYGESAGEGGEAAALQRQQQRSLQLAEGLLGSQGASRGSAVAIVVDAEATGYLMMGALSPGRGGDGLPHDGGLITG